MFYAYEWDDADQEWKLCGAGTDLKALETHCEMCHIHIYGIIGGW